VKIGDLVWVEGNPRDGVPRFLGIIVGHDRPSTGYLRIFGCVTGLVYKYYSFELKKVSEKT
jgi:hypothetical protein